MTREGFLQGKKKANRLGFVLFHLVLVEHEVTTFFFLIQKERKGVPTYLINSDESVSESLWGNQVKARVGLIMEVGR